MAGFKGWLVSQGRDLSNNLVSNWLYELGLKGIFTVGWLGWSYISNIPMPIALLAALVFAIAIHVALLSYRMKTLRSAKAIQNTGVQRQLRIVIALLVLIVVGFGWYFAIPKAPEASIAHLPLDGVLVINGNVVEMNTSQFELDGEKYEVTVTKRKVPTEAQSQKRIPPSVYYSGLANEIRETKMNVDLVSGFDMI